jgi:acyl-CoA thioester hydrolase
VTDEFRHRTRLDVRFRDVDAFGHVNNAVFLSFVEQARIRYLIEVLGRPITLTDVAELPLILARLEIDYRTPIFYGEPAEVATRVDWIGGSSFGMSHQVVAGEDRHCAPALVTVLVSYDYATGRPIAVPAEWRRALESAEGRALQRESKGVR